MTTEELTEVANALIFTVQEQSNTITRLVHQVLELSEAVRGLKGELK